LDKEAFLKALGKHIIELRTEKGISQAELSRLCFKDPQSIERVENGKTNPSIYYLQEIANALNIPLSQLVSF
jgi:putative transcriptional regulator